MVQCARLALLVWLSRGGLAGTEKCKLETRLTCLDSPDVLSDFVAEMGLARQDLNSGSHSKSQHGR